MVHGKRVLVHVYCMYLVGMYVCCMYVYVHVYHTWYTYIHVCMYVPEYSSTRVRTRVHVSTCTSMYRYVYHWY